jgi:endonuclease/exonuclease/phosphatase family metal-dependent hydrolase
MFATILAVYVRLVDRSIYGLLASIAVALAVLLTPVDAYATGNAPVRIMTYNIYQGTNFDEVLTATNPLEFAQAVTAVYNHIQATKIPERAFKVASDIAREAPDLVALQEATILRTGTPLALTEVSDQVNLLLQRLAQLRRPYEVVAVMPGFDPQAPSTLGFDVRVTYRTIIIARSDPVGGISLSNLQVQQFIANGVFDTAGGSFANTRGWASVDVRHRGQTYRFVTTHLEGSPPFSTQQAQVLELLATAGNTSLPVVLVGDFNADANDTTSPTFPTYQLLLNAGFVDAWAEKFPDMPGNTCCQDTNLQNATSNLTQRIDLVLYRGNFKVERIKLIGDQPLDRTPSGLWPSDHAGLSAVLSLGRRP